MSFSIFEGSIDFGLISPNQYRAMMGMLECQLDHDHAKGFCIPPNIVLGEN